MRNFRELRSWTKAMEMCLETYSYSSQLPREEKYNLIQQMQKCAVSIPSNIAEGCSRSSNKDFRRFLEIALGSSYELETQLILSSMIYNNQEELEILEPLQTLQKMLVVFINKLA